MAGSLTDFAENKILDHSVGKTSWTMPATPFLALFTVAPTDAGGGTEVAAVGSYARKAMAGTDWSAASGGAITNANAMTFVTATGSWGTIVAVALMDASTAGNMIWWGDLVVNKAITSGDIFTLPAGDIDFTLA